jgi:hypothetical protein
MKDAATRDCLAKELDIICFEMEAAAYAREFLEALPATGDVSRDSWPNVRFRMLAIYPVSAQVKEAAEQANTGNRR